MIIKFKFAEEIVIMSALEIEDALYVLTPNDTKIIKYLETEDTVVVEFDNIDIKFNAEVINNDGIVREFYLKFEEEKINYFKEFSKNLVLIKLIKA